MVKNFILENTLKSCLLFYNRSLLDADTDDKWKLQFSIKKYYVLSLKFYYES